MGSPQTSLPGLPGVVNATLTSQTLAKRTKYVIAAQPNGGNFALKYREGGPYAYQVSLGSGQSAVLDGDVIESVAFLSGGPLSLYKGIEFVGLDQAQSVGAQTVVLTDGVGVTLPQVTSAQGNQLSTIPSYGMLKGWVSATAAGLVALYLSFGSFNAGQIPLGTATAAGQAMPIPYPGIPVTKGALLNYVNCGATGYYLGVFES